MIRFLDELPERNSEGYGVATDTIGKLLPVVQEGLDLAFQEGRVSALREIQDWLLMSTRTGPVSSVNVQDKILKLLHPVKAN